MQAPVVNENDKETEFSPKSTENDELKISQEIRKQGKE
jgi:hypothetical protein